MPNDAIPPAAATGSRLIPRLWLFVAAAAVLVALLVTGQIYLSMLHHGHSWWRLFAWELGCWSFWALLAPFVLRSGARLVAVEKRRRFLLRHGALSVGATLVHVPITALLTVLLQPWVPLSESDFWGAVRSQTVPWSSVGPLVYWLLLAIGYGLAAYRHNRRLEVRESRLAAELARAQLEALRLKIQPHFLFNTLNGIAALIRRRDNDAALDMVVGLSELLRATLQGSDRQRTSLREELEIVTRYVELQRLRFADRLEVRYEVCDDCLDCEVPTFVLQPLVENALRHGIARRAAASRLDIAAELAQGVLRLVVRDDGPGLGPGFRLEEREGVGLSSTRSRLEQLYGSAASLRVESAGEVGTVAEIVLPATCGTGSGRPGPAVGTGASA